MDTFDVYAVPSEILPDIGDLDICFFDEWLSQITGESCADMPAQSVSAPEPLVQQPPAEPCVAVLESQQEICSAPNNSIIDALLLQPQPKRNTVRPPIAKKRPRADGFWSARLPPQKWSQDNCKVQKQVSACLMNFIKQCEQK